MDGMCEDFLLKVRERMTRTCAKGISSNNHGLDNPKMLLASRIGGRCFIFVGSGSWTFSSSIYNRSWGYQTTMQRLATLKKAPLGQILRGGVQVSCKNPCARQTVQELPLSLPLPLSPGSTSIPIHRRALPCHARMQIR